MRVTRFPRVAALTASFILVQASHSQALADTYRISVLDGDGVINNLDSTTAREPVIQVADSYRRPVAGAYVEFDTPGSGAGANFLNESTHFATTTNSEGLAVGSGIKNNGISGVYLIQVHVSFRGQGIGEVQIRQTNISAGATAGRFQQRSISKGSAEALSNVALPNNVVGIALGDQFAVNGAFTPSNANILKDTRIEALGEPVILYLHESCEYLLSPYSTVTVNPKLVTLEAGSVRARRFGGCRVTQGGVFVTGSSGSDGTATLLGRNLEVAAVAGTLQVVSGDGQVIRTLSPGTVLTFTASSTAASAGGH